MNGSIVAIVIWLLVGVGLSASVLVTALATSQTVHAGPNP